LKRTAIQILIASLDDSPIDGTTQWTVFRVITLIENLIPAIVYLTNKRRDFSVGTVDLGTAD
jgi:hypothetical protein